MRVSLQALETFAAKASAEQIPDGAWDAVMAALDARCAAEDAVQSFAFAALKALASKLPELQRAAAHDAAYASAVRTLNVHPVHHSLWSCGLELLGRLATHKCAALDCGEAVGLTLQAMRQWRDQRWLQSRAVKALSCFLAHPAAVWPCFVDAVQDVVAAMRSFDKCPRSRALPGHCCRFLAALLQPGTTCAAEALAEALKAGAPEAVLAALNAQPSDEALQRDGVAVLAACLAACDSLPAWVAAAPASGPQLVDAACVALQAHPGEEGVLLACLHTMVHSVRLEADSCVRLSRELMGMGITAAADALQSSKSEPVLTAASRVCGLLLRRLPVSLRSQAAPDMCRRLVQAMASHVESAALQHNCVGAIGLFCRTSGCAAAVVEAGAIEAAMAAVRLHSCERLLLVRVMALVGELAWASPASLTEPLASQMLAAVATALSARPVETLAINRV
jgi:hypothetical protein